MLRNVLVGASALLMTGCSLFGMETGYRSLRIVNHRFEPAEVTVPAGQPFVLRIDSFDDRDLTVSAPELGINTLRVPATQGNVDPKIQAQMIPTRYAQLPLGPLAPGRYTIVCSCHGHPSKADIVAQ